MFICGPSKGKKHKKCRTTRGPVLEDVELSSLSSLSIDFTLKSGSLLVFINFLLCEKKHHQLSVSSFRPLQGPPGWLSVDGLLCCWAFQDRKHCLLILPANQATHFPSRKGSHSFQHVSCVQNNLSILFLDLDYSYFFSR